MAKSHSRKKEEPKKTAAGAIDYNKPVQRKTVQAIENGEKANKTVSEMNAAGQILSERTYKPPFSSGKEPFSTLELQYSPTGLLLTEHTIAPTAKYAKVYNYSYNAQNQECQVIRTITDKDGTVQYVTKYEYVNGKKSIGREYIRSNGVDKLSEIHHYDENGWLVQSDSYSGQHIASYTYYKNDAAGRPLEESAMLVSEQSSKDSENEARFPLNKYEYDESGNIIALYLYILGKVCLEWHKRFNSDGECVYETKIEYGKESNISYETTIEDISNEVAAPNAPSEPAASPAPKASAAPADPCKFDSRVDEKFRPLFERASRNDTDALWEIIHRYAEGDEFPRDGNCCFNWLQYATQHLPETKENAGFWNDLANCYTDGDGTERDLDAAIAAYKKSDKLGYHHASVNLGLLYYRETTGETRKKALPYIEKGCQQQNSFAKTILGNIYLEGEIVPKDAAKGVHLLEEAVAAGEADAAYFLATAYDQDGALPPNLEKSYYYYAKAADLGDTRWNSLCAGGLAYAHGQSVPQDFTKARKYLEQVGVDYDEKADFILGSFCFEGLGGPVDRAEGERRLRHAAAGDDPKVATEAKNSLAMYFYQSNEHLSEAISLFESAAIAKNTNAMVNLGKAYYEGKGVSQSRDMAIYYWKQAAELGNQEAVSNLRVIGALYTAPSQSYDQSYSQGYTTPSATEEPKRGGGCLAALGRGIVGFFIALLVLAAVVWLINLIVSI